ncbi:MAG: hypothetical protein DMD91_31085 [Candidatus Rokuibacteriota bacterium]|nr:MAG: hypothetical protein DMD91_31085 [Candidatus Rokubacteria bacterium]
MASTTDGARPLGGRTIAITESRRATELATLITRLGGTPRCAPAVREVPCRDRGPAREALDRICRGEVAAILFLTGVGARAFLELATEHGRRDELVRAFAGMLVGARGPKPVAVLRAAAIAIDLIPTEPTSEALLDALSATRTLRGTTVAVQLFGDDRRLVERLASLGAEPLPIPLYEWALPEDQTPLVQLIDAVTRGQIDVIAFTSSPQIHHLFAVAERLGASDRLTRALRESVTVAVVGPVCEQTLAARGIPAPIQPAKGTMGALVHAIGEHLKRAV